MFTAQLFSRNCGQVSENDSQLIKISIQVYANIAKYKT